MQEMLLGILQELPLTVKLVIFTFCFMMLGIDSLFHDFIQKMISYEITIQVTISIRKK